MSTALEALTQTLNILHKVTQDTNQHRCEQLEPDMIRIYKLDIEWNKYEYDCAIISSVIMCFFLVLVEATGA